MPTAHIICENVQNLSFQCTYCGVADRAIADIQRRGSASCCGDCLSTIFYLVSVSFLTFFSSHYQFCICTFSSKGSFELTPISLRRKELHLQSLPAPLEREGTTKLSMMTRPLLRASPAIATTM